MYLLTLALTFSAQSERGRKTPSASQDATACRNVLPADSARVITRNCMSCRDCGHQLHLSLVVARACPPPGFHVIITTCVGLRKRRARGRICLHIMFVDASAIAAEPRRPLDSCKSRVPHGTESANMTTHACTNASANFFNSIRARSQDSERVARRNNMPQRAAN